jgi:hypothetical protein
LEAILLLLQASFDFRLTLPKCLAGFIPSTFIPDVKIFALARIILLEETAIVITDRYDNGLGYFQLVKLG